MTDEDKKMSYEEHKARHQMLHKHLDELIADRISHSDPRGETWLPSRNTVFDLMKWSHEQSLNPTDPRS